MSKIKGLYKNKINHEKDIEEKLYNEISKMNSELVNTKRQLEKKIKEADILNKKLQELVVKDPLTDLYNRRYFYENIVKEISKSIRLDYKISIVMIDLNNFKTINDKFGHDKGDEVLKDFSNICKSNLREYFDYAVRWGGDEFLIVLLNCSEKECYEAINRIGIKFKNSNSISSISYGIVEIDNKDYDIENIIKEADDKMYAYKQNYKIKQNNIF